MKSLIDLCKKHYPDFRHEFNGETWNLWFNHDADYPDACGVSNDVATAVMIGKLEQRSADFKSTAERVTAMAREIDEVLKKMKDRL